MTEALPQLGVCYFPEHWPRKRWQQDARLMREAGLSVVRLGEFAWGRIEPEPGQFDWQWLDDAVAVLAKEGLKLILCTPTATPPKWLVDSMPDMIAIDRDGRPRGFGSRRHYCFSHTGYRTQAERITSEVAQRYGQHPALVGWQTDNEYGCHDTVQSFSSAARTAFRHWLEARYGEISALNDAWGNGFWSMEYRSFEEIELPNLTVTEANPAHWLAFRRFSSDQVIAFNKAQVDILKESSPGRDIYHNAMGFYTGYDHHDLGYDLDVMGWDSYPLGFLEMFRFTDTQKQQFARAGHPDIAAFHHDLYRGTTENGRWCVLEQQPGPVNWARHNPAPAKGMVHLWTMEAAAHGAELVAYFRFRQFPKAQEQMHAGLLRSDGEPAPAYGEAQQAAAQLDALGSLGPSVKQAALIFSYQAEWMSQIQPHGEGRSAIWAAFDCYSALRKLGLNVDILPPGADLSGYSIVVLPAIPIIDDAMIAQLRHFAGQVIITPRCGSRDDDFGIPEKLAPGPLQQLFPAKVINSESLRPGLSHEGEGWEITGWLDHLDTNAAAELVAKDGTVACWRHKNWRYCTGWPTGRLIDHIMALAAKEAGLPDIALPEGLRLRRTENYLFAFNYSDHAVSLAEGFGALAANQQPSQIAAHSMMILPQG